ncbi:MAG: hypothetical protein KIS80_01635 [Anaerolineales bacterium]|nr:hypothetical protein [Anaerolineales bacterium]
MQIIGAGFGRTGTLSLKAALEQLGYAPCYHMLEVLQHPSHIATWQAAADGQPVDWPAFLGGYPAGLDYPLAGFYKELLVAFPKAKVILSVRDPQGWYESTRETIYKGAALPHWLTRLLPPYRGFYRMVTATVWERLFHGRFGERNYAIARFDEHIEDVKRHVPADRLLIFDVRQGWEPLCAFLGTPIPETAFPRINERWMLQSAIWLGRVLPWALAAGLLVLIGQLLS